MSVSEESAVATMMYGKTAEEWWAVWESQSEISAEARNRAGVARQQAWPADPSKGPEAVEAVRSVYRELQRENELQQARADLVYIFYKMTEYDVNILREFIDEFIV